MKNRKSLLLIIAWNACLNLQCTHSWTTVPIVTLRTLTPSASTSTSTSTSPSTFACHTTTRSKQRITRCYMANSNTVTGIESTPNPSSFLVKLSAPLAGLEDLAGTLQGRSYSSPVTLLTPPELAVMLQIDGVESVYGMALALTINKKASAKWDILLPLVLKALGVDEQQGLLDTTASTTASTSASSSGQVRIRLQISNKIPIQIEAIGYLGTPKRSKLSPKFQEHMQVMVDDGVDFFAGRKWVDRGVRYLDEMTMTMQDAVVLDEAGQEDLELTIVLQSELEEMDAAYSSERLAAIVLASSLGKGAVPITTASGTTTTASPEDSTTSADDLTLERVDQYCNLAEQEGSEEALEILAHFVASGDGLLAARRNALAFLGGTGDISASAAIMDLVFGAIASALENEKKPTMRRTAGDALSDLGDVRAVPCAVKALGDKSKLVQWRAARVLGELADSTDIVAVLKQASFNSDYAFEVAFEIKDAMRKVRARVQTKDSGINGDGPATGPMWKQIQEGTRTDLGTSS